MVTQEEAVRLWEDNVGDSGEAPTGYELRDYANVVYKKAIQPVIDLAEGWTKRANELDDKARWALRTGQNGIAHALETRARSYRHLASEVLGTVAPTD